MYFISSTFLKRAATLLIYGCILYGAWLMLLITLQYLAFTSNVDFLITKQSVYPQLHWKASFYIHVFTGLLVLVPGLVQFNRYIIRHCKRLHRISGYIYVTCVLGITGPSGLIMAFYANGGLPARISFVLLALLWIGFTLLAVRAALQKRFVVHGAWMTRSYALTLSALTLRFYTYVIGYSEIDISPLHEYILVSWLSWTLNLLVAEILIRRGWVKNLIAAAQPIMTQ